MSIVSQSTETHGQDFPSNFKYSIKRFKKFVESLTSTPDKIDENFWVEARPLMRYLGWWEDSFTIIPHDNQGLTKEFAYPVYECLDRVFQEVFPSEKGFDRQSDAQAVQSWIERYGHYFEAEEFQKKLRAFAQKEGFEITKLEFVRKAGNVIFIKEKLEKLILFLGRTSEELEKIK